MAFLYCSERSGLSATRSSMALFISPTDRPLMPGTCWHHQTCLSTFTFSQGGFPSKQSNPGLSPQNTSGNRAGKWAGRSQSKASSTSFLLWFALMVSSSKPSMSITPARLADTKSNCMVAICTFSAISALSCRDSSTSSMVASGLAAIFSHASLPAFRCPSICCR